MTDPIDSSARAKAILSLSLAALLAGAAPAGALTPPPARPVAEASAEALQARVEAAIRQLRDARPSIGQGEAAPLHLAQWRNR